MAQQQISNRELPIENYQVICLETMRREDAPAIKALWWNGLIEGRISPDEERVFWHQWGRIDGRAAAELAAKEDFTSAIPDILAGWARIDQAAALTFLNENPSPISRPQDAIKAITTALAADSTESAIQFVRFHADDSIFQETLGVEMDFIVREKGLTAGKEALGEIARSTLSDAYKNAKLVKLTGRYEKAPWALHPGTTGNDEIIEISRQYPPHTCETRLDRRSYRALAGGSAKALSRSHGGRSCVP